MVDDTGCPRSDGEWKDSYDLDLLYRGIGGQMPCGRQRQKTASLV